jgi:hypothetical protein
MTDILSSMRSRNGCKISDRISHGEARRLEQHAPIARKPQGTTALSKPHSGQTSSEAGSRERISAREPEAVSRVASLL